MAIFIIERIWQFITKLLAALQQLANESPVNKRSAIRELVS